MQIPQAIQASATLTLTRIALAHIHLLMAESAFQRGQRYECLARTRRLVAILVQSLAVPGPTLVAAEWLAAIDRIELRVRELETWP